MERGRRPWQGEMVRTDGRNMEESWKAVGETAGRGSYYRKGAAILDILPESGAPNPIELREA